MPDYVINALLRKFQHPLPNHQSCHAMPHISVSDQLTSKPYNLQQKRTIQQKFLLTRLLSHAFNPSLERFYIMLEEIESPALPVFNEIGTQQSNPTTTTNTAINELMDFLTTHPNGIIRYYVSGMVLYVDTDNAAYKSMRQKRSKAWDMRCNWLRDRSAQDQFHAFLGQRIQQSCWFRYKTSSTSTSYCNPTKL